MPKDIVIRARKFQNNRLLNRRQCIVDVYHPKAANLTFEEIKTEISTRFKCGTDSISLFKFYNKFGGGKSSGFCLIYDSKDYKLKYEPKYRLRREQLADKKDSAKTRKTRKNLKVKCRNLRGKAKVKVMNA